jgi:hypothetical protein
MIFMTDTCNYYYKLMSFGLNNDDATCQRMMNEIYKNQIGNMLEVYMDNMMVKPPKKSHTRLF